ncbi:MAG TPA: nucleotidyltransferase domain-containing protein [Bacteroidales bacterium]|nr:nucleotidyltransferase domain-containing protein [Bacteroidales bacterium]
MKNNRNVSELIKAVAKGYFPDGEVMLFGSRSRNSASSDSDYDILIVTDQKLSSEEKISYRTRIRKDLLKDGIRSDILIQNREDIEKKRRLPGHIIRNIIKEAIML